MTLAPIDGVNVIYGANGSGKTSILEAIYVLSHGRSFRTSRFKNMIQQSSERFVVHGKKLHLQLSLPVGISKYRDGQTDIKVQGQAVKRMADLADVLPVQVITPESYDLFFGGPKERRRFLDLGVFHVKHTFFQKWQSYNRVLQQRNALLKKKPTGFKSQLSVWDAELCRLAEEINSLRLEYLEQFKAHFFDKISCDLMILNDVVIDYHTGWRQGISMADALQESLERDCQLGYTSRGPHKADITFKVGDVAAESYFSRGQLKLLLYALKVTQNGLIESLANKRSILLIDDLPSELSEDTRADVGKLLQRSQAQLFITTITADSVSPVLEQVKREQQMFHVKHGNLITS